MSNRIPSFKVLSGVESASKKTFYQLDTYIHAGRPLIYVPHFDFRTIDTMIARIREENEMEVTEYVSGVGTVEFDGKEVRDKDETLAGLLSKYVKQDSFDRDIILLLKNVHKELEEPAVQSLLRQVAGESMKEYEGEPEDGDEARLPFAVYVVIVSPVIMIPPTVDRLMSLVTLGAPSEEEIREHLKIELGKNGIPISDEVLKETSLSMRGLSEFEIDQVVSMIVCSNKTLGSKEANEIILEEKRQLVHKSGLLKIVDPGTGGQKIGGLDELQKYLDSEKKIYQDLSHAKDFGVEIPKGILIVGMPGCGKTLTAKLTAEKFGVPLICLAIGKLMGPYVGQSEENMRRALMTVEAAAPCVLWIDELEKAFAGVTAGGQGGGSEVTTRLFGSFLTWMQEKRDSVYVIATANRISQLPPEFLRRGRFDEIFRVDFPNEKEREAIFRVHWERRKSSEGYGSGINLKALAAASDGYCGADIATAIGNAFKRAFLAGKAKVTQAMLEEEVKALTPLKKTLKDDLKELEETLKKYSFRPASVK